MFCEGAERSKYDGRRYTAGNSEELKECYEMCGVLVDGGGKNAETGGGKRSFLPRDSGDC